MALLKHSLLLAILAPLTLAATTTSPAPAVTSCPTIHITTSQHSCPTLTQHCFTPFCILLSPVTVPCGCPTVIPRSTHYTSCPTTCNGGCGTSYQTNLLPCSSTFSSPKSTSTSTSTTWTPISDPTPTTSTTRSTPYSDPSPTQTSTPKTLSTVTVTTITQPTTCHTITKTAGPDCWKAGCATTYSSGCKTIPTVLRCGTNTCDGGCATGYKTLYPPCPFPTTLIGGPIGVPTEVSA